MAKVKNVYYIKIYRKSIQFSKPPAEFVFGARRITFSGQCLDIDYDMIGKGKEEGMIPLEALKGAVIERVEVDEGVRSMKSLGPPRLFDFEYKPTKVHCHMCGATFQHTALRKEWDEDDEWGGYHENICPRCNEEDCCVLHFETLPEKKMKYYANKNKREQGRPKKAKKKGASPKKKKR